METEVLSTLKFGDCSPQQDGCPSDGMSSDATVLCIDSDAEDDAQSQDGFGPELDSRLKEKGLQGGPEQITRFQGSPLSPAPCVGKGLRAMDRTAMNGGQPKFFAKMSDAEVLGETASFETLGKISCGRERELVEIAAGAPAASAQGKRVLCEGPPPGLSCAQSEERGGKSMQSDSGKKKKGTKNKKIASAWQPTEDQHKVENRHASELKCQAEAKQQPVHQKGRRRGRRGGRGRKQVETEVQEDVPKLEKGLEEELAEQLANQASNGSALSIGFSSVRLHVPGGNTMIILNDHELRDGTTPDDILDKIESSLPSPEETIRRNHVAGAGKRAGGAPDGSTGAQGAAFTETCHHKTTSKGCGAFFPPSLLKEMLNEPAMVNSRRMQRPTHRRMHTERAESMSYDQKLDIKAPPFMPFSSFSLNDYRSAGAESFGSSEGQVALLPAEILPEQAENSQKARTGTGCFMPLYSRDVIAKREEPPRHIARVSLAESLSSLDDVSFSTRRNRLKFEMPPLETPKDVCDDTLFEDESDTDIENKSGSEASLGLLSSPRCPVGNNVGAVQGDCARVVVGELSAAGRPDNPRDELMQLLEGSKFTSFTSPLHLEETLDGLQEEREARENAESRLVELEMENLKLRGGSGKIGDLQSELSKAQEVSRAMQVLLFVALAKPDKLRFRPKGMFHDPPKVGDCEVVAPEGKRTKTVKSTETAIPKDIARRSVAGADTTKNSARKARSVSSSDLKMAGTRPGHARTASANTPTVSKVTSLRGKVTEITKTTTATKSQTTTEETTTTKERKTMKKASTTSLPAPMRKTKSIQNRWH
ncbi:unnamed protein product [Ostreobium quekettii]|uniref:Uncharacterized protein n=1 Tax=Ostreobium quekettii TaxID=121088 RepID=A0A8S1IWC3_9CHLO|nr:unnamed protein product [Ostreobium quekettii]|eukprot:evm.model.scf_260.1 EVM.evm.TU.scf_260.1   scf_260:1973-5716(-)